MITSVDRATVPIWTVLHSREEYGDTTLPLLSMSAHYGVRGRDSSEGRAPSDDMSNYRVVRVGDIVVNKLSARDGAFGRSPLDGVISPAYWVLKCDPSVWDSRFLHYLLHSAPWRAEIRRRSKMMPPAQFDLPWDQFKSLRVPELGLDEQRRIADFLDDQTTRIDQAIVLRRKQNMLLHERFRAHTEQILERADRPIPLRRRVDAVCVGIVIQPAALYVDEADDGVPALRGTDVHEGCIDTSAPVRISRVGHSDNRRSTLRRGDVVVVRTGLAGVAAVVGEDTEGWNCIDLVIVRPNKGLVAEFLEFVLNHFSSQARIGAASSGSIQAHFGVGAVRELPIPDFSVDEQQRAVERLKQQREFLAQSDDAMALQSALLGERRRALITAAVTGGFDVSAASTRAVGTGA